MSRCQGTALRLVRTAVMTVRNTIADGDTRKAQPDHEVLEIGVVWYPRGNSCGISAGRCRRQIERPSRRREVPALTGQRPSSVALVEVAQLWNSPRSILTTAEARPAALLRSSASIAVTTMSRSAGGVRPAGQHHQRQHESDVRISPPPAALENSSSSARHVRRECAAQRLFRRLGETTPVARKRGQDPERARARCGP